MQQMIQQGSVATSIPAPAPAPLGLPPGFRLNPETLKQPTDAISPRPALANDGRKRARRVVAQNIVKANIRPGSGGEKWARLNVEGYPLLMQNWEKSQNRKQLSWDFQKET
ncbi:unnamed protein product, partial [Mesorhabditis belari]|uniref:Uncharacterized protein n=1 Tax=Mesorhabditis belari TaxID=2138241 RepID=A0AAF3J8X2_9BILA